MTIEMKHIGMWMISGGIILSDWRVAAHLIVECIFGLSLKVLVSIKVGFAPNSTRDHSSNGMMADLDGCFRAVDCVRCVQRCFFAVKWDGSTACVKNVTDLGNNILKLVHPGEGCHPSVDTDVPLAASSGFPTIVLGGALGMCVVLGLLALALVCFLNWVTISRRLGDFWTRFVRFICCMTLPTFSTRRLREMIDATSDSQSFPSGHDNPNYMIPMTSVNSSVPPPRPSNSLPDPSPAIGTGPDSRIGSNPADIVVNIPLQPMEPTAGSSNGLRPSTLKKTEECKEKVLEEKKKTEERKKKKENKAPWK